MNKFFSIVVIFFLLLIIACNYQTEDSEEFESIQNLVDLNCLSELLHAKSFYFKRTHPNNSSLLFCDSILEGKIKLMDLWNAVEYENDIFWDTAKVKDNSWNLYFQSLRMVSILLNGYEKTEKSIYYARAKEISFDWISDHKDTHKNGPNLNKAWSDHAVANRVLTLTYLLEIGKKYELLDNDEIIILLKTLYQHNEWLYDNENYPSGNHGIMVNRALLQSALLYDCFNNSEKWKDKSLDRLYDSFSGDVSPKGVHLENSPGYHLHVLRLLRNFMDISSFYDVKLSDEFDALYSNMIYYLAYLYKPDGKLPYIGDTRRSADIEDISFTNNEILFQKTNGQKGNYTKPWFYDEVSGVVVGKPLNESNQLENSSYLFFQGGFNSAIHKHSDNLSFVFSSCGHDIIVDGGHYSYTSSEWKKYFRSVYAHNNIVINGSTYNTRLLKPGDVAIDSIYFNEEYLYINSHHKGYEPTIVKRELIFIIPNLIILKDKILENKSNDRIEQIFNFSKSTQLIRSDLSTTELAIDTLITIYLKQHLPIDTFSVYKGSYNLIRGWQSNNTLLKYPIQQLSFIQKENTKKVFITSIFIESDKFSEPVESFSIVGQEDKTLIEWMRLNTQNEISLTDIDIETNTVSFD